MLVGEQPDAIELALEEPVASAEPLLCQRGGHWFEPVGHFRSVHWLPDDFRTGKQSNQLRHYFSEPRAQNARPRGLSGACYPQPCRNSNCKAPRARCRTTAIVYGCSEKCPN